MLDSSTEEAIFDAALSLSDPAKRSEYLGASCHGDQALRHRIDSLLTAAEESGSFMRTPAVHALEEDGHRETLFDITTDGSTKPDIDSLIGRTIGYYRIVARIGSGGMGEVYLAEDTRLGRKVALKIISPSWTGNATHRFVREAQLAAAPDHPNVCPVYDIGQTPEWCFIVMQYIEGQTLEQLIGAGPLATETILAIALQTCHALSAAHERGIIHSDIKSRNIMVTSRGQAIVLDFGLAKLLEQERREKSRIDRVVGTPAFMSPEQARGGELDCRSDIFALGVVLFHMATGTTPFRGASSAEVMHSVIAEPPHTAVRNLNPNIPQELASVVDRALCKAPEDRYQTIEEMASDLRAIQSQIALRKHPASVSARRQRQAISMVAAASLLIGLGWFAWQAVNLSWARQQIPVIKRLTQARAFPDAYDLAKRVRKYLPEDPTLTRRLMPVISDSLSVTSEPPGARVCLKLYVPGPTSASPPPKFVGETPISVEVARGSYVVSVEKDGFEPFQRTWMNAVSGTREEPIPFPYSIGEIKAILTPVGTAPDGMVFVPGRKHRLESWNRPIDVEVELGDYWIDRCEVTNREFKEFVEEEGYSNPDFWTRPFVKDGRTLPWEEAMLALVDTSGQPGPRNWSGGTFPEGTADHPVSNITWYEAAAYAAFRRKSLPNVYQWEMAARRDANKNFLGVTMPWGMHEGSVADRANLKTRGAVAVGCMEFGMSPYGCYEMAGNVSEWCLNETSRGYIAAGGSFASLPQAWCTFGVYPAFCSSEEIGFRCVLNSTGSKGNQGAMRIELDDEIPKFYPAPEAEVRDRFAYYEYDHELPLDATVQATETDEWRCERITYNGADGKRALAYLYLPKRVPGPHQVIHLLPPGAVTYGFYTVPQSIETEYAAFLRSGRAVFIVVLEGYREREIAVPTWLKNLNGASMEYVDEYARHIFDMRRGLDYLMSRDDVDSDRVAFFGASFGNAFFVLPAIESRYSAFIFLSTGISKYGERIHEAARPIDFVPLIHGPTLLVHGRFDEATPLRTMAEPLYELLTGEKRKEFYEGAHWPDEKGLVEPASTFLDEFFGPVTQK